MCGIAGFCDFKRNSLQDAEQWTTVHRTMRTAIAHRGHDQTGEYLRRNVGLAHTRLSIRDLAGGAQPMVRWQGEEEYAIVYNGEIYNADELKEELRCRGYRFETTCDTEVILCAQWDLRLRCLGRTEARPLSLPGSAGGETSVLCSGRNHSDIWLGTQGPVCLSGHHAPGGSGQLSGNFRSWSGTNPRLRRVPGAVGGKAGLHSGVFPGRRERVPLLVPGGKTSYRQL